MYDTAQVGSKVFEQQRSAIIVRCTEDLEKAISNLNKKIGALDVAVKIATIIGGVATLVMVVKIFLE